MNAIFRLLALLLAMASPGFAEVPAEIRQDLTRLVPELVRLLEAKDYVAVLETAVPPDALKKATENRPLKEFAAEFGEKKAANLLTALKAIKDVKPQMDADGNTATFAVPDSPKSRPQIIFKRIEKNWYIKN
jgi:hypothetical protein